MALRSGRGLPRHKPPPKASTRRFSEDPASAEFFAQVAQGFVHQLRTMGVTPHVAQYPETKTRGSAIDARTTRHPGYTVSQQKRKLVKQCFGWMKTVGLMRKLRHRGGARVNWNFIFTAAAYNLVRMRTLLAQPA